MLGEFVKSMSGKLADRWAGLGSAVVFWFGLLGVWLWAHDGWRRVGQASGWLAGQSDLSALVVLVGALLVAAAPAVLVARVSAPVLRLLEGYWPARGVRDWRIRARQQQLASELAAFQQLAAASHAGQALTRDQIEAYARLDRSLHHRPTDPGRVMPTRVGDVLRAGEDRPRTRYGLDSVIVWPRLWLVLPEATRLELATARGSLDQAVAGVVWGLLFAAASPLAAAAGASTGWGLPALAGAAVGVGTATAAGLWWLPVRAMTFAVLLDASFDLHRFTLYEQLRWPLPATPGQEPQTGAALTAFLWRGSHATQPRFTTGSDTSHPAGPV